MARSVLTRGHEGRALDEGSRIPRGHCLANFALKPLLATATRLNIDVDAECNAAGIHPAVFERGLRYVEATRAHALAMRLSRLAAGRPLGLLAAEQTRVGDLGILGYLCGAAFTLREVASLTLRFYGIVDTTVRIELVEEARDGVVRVETTAQPALVPVLVEQFMATMVELSRQLTRRDVAVHEVCFTHALGGKTATKSRIAAYERYFRGAVRFGAAANELRFPREHLDLRVAAPDAALRGVLEEYADSLSGTRAEVGAFVERVRSALHEGLLHADVSIDGIAKRFGMTRRTLQRRLTQEGTALQTLLDETRRDLATRYTEDGRIPIAQVARVLGYQDPAQLRRAIRRWRREPKEH